MSGLLFPKPESRASDRRVRARNRERQWQAVRKAVLARDGNRCRACGLKEGTEVHHIRFRSLGGEDSPANCAAICDRCHSDIHAYRLNIEGDANGKLRIERTK
jgi:5-methylcytosine-specific restriction endonuclease McrA